MTHFPKVHPETAKIARKFGREQLAAQDVKLRAPTMPERVEVFAKTGMDLEATQDAVVIRSKKDGSEWLVGIEVDPAMSRHLNAESGVLTAAGLVPVLGAPAVAAFALKDIIKGGIPALKAKLNGDATSPRDRALVRMGLKHLGLASASMATHGSSQAMHIAHGAVQASEVAVAGKDLVEGRASGASIASGMMRSALAGLQGIAGVHHHDDHHDNDARILVTDSRLSESRAAREANKRARLDSQVAGTPESKTGPPSSH